MQVRTCAQKVIDGINESYKKEKMALDAAHQAMFAQMQSKASQATLGVNLSAHLARQDAPAVTPSQQTTVCPSVPLGARQT